MNDKLCLRCDWSGRTRDRTCPSCGARLFAAPSAAPARHPRSAHIRRTQSERDEPLVEQVPVQPRTARSRRPVLPAWLPVAVVVALAVVAVVFVQRHTPPPREPVAGLSGSLLYASSTVSGLSQLWVWDLPTDTLHPGPRVREPLELVDASLSRPGWIGVTSRLAGGQRASLLRSLTPSDHAETLLGGDLVSWSPGGEFVTAAALGGEPCGRLRVRSFSLTVRQQAQRLDTFFCGRLVNFGRDASLPYLSYVAQHASAASITAVGNGYLHGLVDGFAALSVSRAGDLLVVPAGRAFELGTGPARDLALVYGSPRPHHPIPFGTPGHGLAAERVLCWNDDASQAYVLGSVDGIRGVYSIPVGPGRDPKVPVLLTATGAVHVAATAVSGGELVLALDGSLALIRDGELAWLDLPDGAAPVVGPILWTSSLGYSGP